jgi:hypothetical protein
MNHYVYLIEKKNTLPNQQKYYIGVRSCEVLIGDDSYMGSSKYLTEEVETLGADQFNKIILKRFSNREEAVQYEIDMHNEFDVANNPLFFNRAKQTSVSFIGGVGENNYFYGKKHTPETLKKMSEILKTKDCRQKTTNKGKKFPEAGKKISVARKNYYKTNPHPMLGVKRTKEMQINNSLGALKQQKHECVYCGVVTIAGNIKRWHNDNCKDKG